MFRIFHLVRFLLISYWRRSYGLLQALVVALTCGIFLDRNFAPYSYDYVVLLRNITMIIIASITASQLINKAYTRSLYVLLSRMERPHYYLGSLLASIVYTVFWGLVFDLYVAFFAQLPLSEYLAIEQLVLGLVNIIIVVVTIHFFSPYTLDNRYQLIGFLTVFLGFIPRWFENLPGEPVLKVLSFFLPPLGSTTLIQQARLFSSAPIALGLSLAYPAVLIWAGLCLFSRKSLSTL